MTTAEFLLALGRANLAMAAAIVLVIALRAPLRRWLGARAAYRLWLLPLLAAVAVLAPPRVVTIQASLPAPQPLTVAAVAAAPAAEFVSSPVARSPRDTWPLLLALWLAGAAVFGAHLAVRQRRFLSLAAQGRAGPAAVGVVRPRIVLPADFTERFTAAEQQAVLAHEEAHIAAGHPRINGLVAVAQGLCWFNPLAHLGAHLMRMDQELACDAMVVTRRPADRRLYAQTLLKTQLAATPLPLGCYWPAGADHPLTMRVAMLSHASPGRAHRMASATLIALLGASTSLAAWAAQPAQVQYAPAVQRADGHSPTPPSGGAVVPTRAAEDSPIKVDPWKAVEQRAALTQKPVASRIMQMTGTFRSAHGETRRAGFTTVGSSAAWRTMIGERAVLVRFVDDGERLKVFVIVGSADGQVRETAPIEVVSGSPGKLTLPDGASLSFTAVARDSGPEDETMMHAAAGARAAAEARSKTLHQAPTSRTEKSSALSAGDWRRAASLGATAADVVRALQEKGRYRDLNAWQAVVTISPDNLVEAIPMKPLPPIDGAPASTRTAGLAGSGFSFTAKPGTVILYPSYAGTFDAPARAAEGRLAQANLEIARSELEDARRKFEVGLITRIDLMKYERDVLAAEVRAKDAGGL